MWTGLQNESLAFVVTDHCPFTMAQRQGKRRTPEFRRLPEGTISIAPEMSWADAAPPFNQMPGGAPGIETRLSLVYHFGVNQGRLSLNQFVNVTSTAAAKRYGLYPQKGTITPGADADLVLLDPNHEMTITAKILHQNCDYTPYEGFHLKGWPSTVLSRGKVIVQNGKFVGVQGQGRYLKRNRGKNRND
jgi:dihydropyrimidinase